MADLSKLLELYCEDNGKDFYEDTDSLRIVLETYIKGEVSPKGWLVEGLEHPAMDLLKKKFGEKADMEESNFNEAEKRTKEYGSVQDQLDEIYHDMDA